MEDRLLSRSPSFHPAVGSLLPTGFADEFDESAFAEGFAHRAAVLFFDREQRLFFHRAHRNNQSAGVFELIE